MKVLMAKHSGFRSLPRENRTRNFGPDQKRRIINPSLKDSRQKKRGNSYRQQRTHIDCTKLKVYREGHKPRLCKRSSKSFASNTINIKTNKKVKLVNSMSEVDTEYKFAMTSKFNTFTSAFSKTTVVSDRQSQLNFQEPGHENSILSWKKN